MGEPPAEQHGAPHVTAANAKPADQLVTVGLHPLPVGKGGARTYPPNGLGNLYSRDDLLLVVPGFAAVVVGETDVVKCQTSARVDPEVVADERRRRQRCSRGAARSAADPRCAPTAGRCGRSASGSAL